MFLRLAPSPLVLGYSRPLVGVNTESSEVIQEIPRPLFFLPLHTTRCPITLPNIAQFGSLVSSMRGTNPANSIRLLRIILSTLSLPVFMRVSSVWLLPRRPLQRVRKLWWARCSVSSWQLRELHVTQPYNVVPSTSAPDIRILSSRGAYGRSYSSRVYFRKLHHALRMCRSTSMDRSVSLWLRFPQVYELVRLVVHLAGCLYVGYGGFLRHPLRALTYDLNLSLRYGEAKRRAHVTPIIFMSCAVKFQATLASSSYSMPHSKVKRAGSPSVAPPRPPAPILFLRCTRESVKSLSGLKRV